MAEANPPVAAVPDDGGAMEARFADLCKEKLLLDEGLARQAMVLFKESKYILVASMSSLASGSPEEIERYWSAFVLYCTLRLGKSARARQDGEGGVMLCQILRASRLNIVDFFKEVPQFCIKVGYILTGLYGSDWERKLELKELQANVVHLGLLSRYYRRAYQDLFLAEEKDLTWDCTGLVSECYRFGWLLFLILRTRTFSRFTDLVSSTNGLLSVLATLMVHMPINLRNSSIKDLPNDDKKENAVKVFAFLAEKYHTSEEELSFLLEKTNGVIVDVLKKKPCLSTSVLDGLVYFDNLLEESSLPSSLLALEKEYERIISSKGELDERVFASAEDSFVGSGSLSGGAINLSASKRKYDSVDSPAKSIMGPMSPPRFPGSPLNRNGSCQSKLAPATPVSTAMTTAKWLRNALSNISARPSAELSRFFSACDRNVQDEIIHRTGIILGAIFSGSLFGDHCVSTAQTNTSRVNAIWAEQRKNEALKLYYRVLESMCRAESQILNGNNLTPLLSNECFHRCMLACSAELVLATHKTVTMMFPAVLEKTGITAYDLSKVIESFVRHEDTLPRELKRHLNSLEERLLESMAWEKGSSLYNSLIVARPALAMEINRLGLLAEPMPSLDAISTQNNISLRGLPPLPFSKQEASSDQSVEVKTPKKVPYESKYNLLDGNSFRSPVKEHNLNCNGVKPKLPPLQSAFATPTRPNPAKRGETCAELGIEVFLSKISKLAAIRIKSLGDRMQISQQSQELVYSLVQQILSQQTSLFFNRHVDQIILCAIYGVAKVSQLSLTFKEIIFNYRKQPQCKPQVFRSVYVCWPPSGSRTGKTGEDHIDIITFYNEVFIPAVKPLLVERGPSGVAPSSKATNDGAVPESPKPCFSNLPDMSPKKVSAVHNVYVSPLRSSKMDSLLSPSSKSYFACVGESTHAYQSPSKDLSVINNRLNGGRKINARLNFDMVTDSDVVGSLAEPKGNNSTASPSVKLLVKSEPPEL